MKLIKLSLTAAVCACAVSSLSAADSVAEAITNGKFGGTVKTTYANKTVDNRGEAATGDNDYEAFGVGLELGYVTDPLYGFRIGLAGQGWLMPYHVGSSNKTAYDKEWYTKGAVLSELYLGYGIGNTDIKAGRQYVVTPLVAGNYTRAFKEAFEGVAISNKDIPDTTLWGGWFYKFQGRSKTAMGAPAGEGKAPLFKDRVILGNMTGPVAVKFENIFSAYVQNKSLPYTTLTGAYAAVTDVKPANALKDGDVSLYLAEANVKVPVGEVLKLGFDLNYKGSRVDGGLEPRRLDGDMFGARVSVSEFFGFGLSYAYTTVSDDDAVILGVGNGPGSYTALPIRGPFVFTGYAGMDTHKIVLDYNFGAIGLDGFKTALHYVKGDQDRVGGTNNINASGAAGQKVGTSMDVEGWAVTANYAPKAIKGLSLGVTYTALERSDHYASGVNRKFDENEIWLQAAYKFDLSGN